MPTTAVRLRYRAEMKGAREYEVPAMRFGMAEATYTGRDGDCWVFEAKLAYRSVPTDIKVVRTRRNDWGETDSLCIGTFTLSGEEYIEVDWSAPRGRKAEVPARPSGNPMLFTICAAVVLVSVLAAAFFALTTPDADNATSIMLVLIFSVGPALTLGFILGTRDSDLVCKVVLALSAVGIVANAYLCISPVEAQLMFFVMNVIASAVMAVAAYLCMTGRTTNMLRR